MEKFKQFIEFVQMQPIWIKSLSVLIVTLVSIVLFFSSCSVSQNVVTGDHSNGSASGAVEVVIDSTYMSPTFKF